MSPTHSLKVFRPLNLAFLAILQGITYFFLDFNADLSVFDNHGFWALVLATLLIAGAGYLINDHYDRLADEVNKPNNRPIETWKPKNIWKTYIALNLMALVLGNYLGFRWVVLFVLIIGTLWLYSIQLKRLPISGNLIVSIFAFASVYLVYDVFRTQNQAFVLFYAAAAALFTLLRELAKDIEDMKGDGGAKFYTLPVLSGFTMAKFILAAITAFTLCIYTMFQYKWVGHFFSGNLLLVFVGYQLLCILLPLTILLVMILRARSSNDMTGISKMLKYVMATGMLSMAFF